MRPHTVTPTAPPEIASDTLDTLLALIKHRKDCGQCRLDERWCDTAGTYERLFMEGVKRYKHAKERA
jgi:hypothetical protein